MLLVAYGPTSGSYDLFAYDLVGNVWNGAAYVTPPASGTDPTAYRIAATQGPSGRYTATAPAGCYGWDLRLRASTWAASTVIWAETGANVVAVNGGPVLPSSLSITVTPLVAASAGGSPTPQFLSLAQNSAPLYAFTCTNKITGAAVDLSGKTVRFAAATQAFGASPEVSGLFKYETGAGITIGGTSNNVASVQFAAADTATAQRLAWILWNVTDAVELARGTLDITPAVFDVT